MRPPRWLRAVAGRRVAVALAWVLLLVALAAAVDAVGVRVVGSVTGWQRWLRAHEGAFLAWRLALYSATAWGWWRMRARLRRRAPAAEARRRLLRAEVAAVIVILLVEGLRWLPLPPHA
ncbi:MAG TPA: hypothetical protein VF457_06410 [Burkholderiaceae bacterium]